MPKKTKKDLLIAEIECCFDKNRTGIVFHGDRSAKITLVVDGKQLASVANLLLLVGQEKTFKAVFYECPDQTRKSRLPNKNL